MVLYLLFESAQGYALFRCDAAASAGEDVDDATFDGFTRHVTLHAFRPYFSSASALENITAISEGKVHDELKSFLLASLPRDECVQLGVGDDALGAAISEALSGQQTCTCLSTATVFQLLRGVRMHFPQFIDKYPGGFQEATAQVHISQSYAQERLLSTVDENVIKQAIQSFDHLDQELQTQGQRLREWYGWHFPELSKLVTDDRTYARIVRLLKDRANEDTAHLQKQLTDIVQDENLAVQVLAGSSMGTELSEEDMHNIDKLAGQVVSMAEQHDEMRNYLHMIMERAVPNLVATLGPIVGARIIAQAGTLAVSPSPEQVLTAERALFRALKESEERGDNVNNIGLTFHSTATRSHQVAARDDELEKSLEHLSTDE